MWGGYCLQVEKLYSSSGKGLQAVDANEPLVALANCGIWVSEMDQNQREASLSLSHAHRCMPDSLFPHCTLW